MVERVEFRHANSGEHALVFCLDDFLHMGCQRFLEQVVIVDAQMTVLVDRDEEHSHIVDGVALVFFDIGRISFLAVEHTTA